MSRTRLKWVTLPVTLSAILLVGACKKKVAPLPPPPPPLQAPTASLTVTPSTIELGQSTTLTWQTSNATDVLIEGVGAVDASGSRTETPTESFTYRLTAKGPGGTAEAVTRVTVTEPPPVLQPPSPLPTDADLFQQTVKDIFFDFDKYNIRAEQKPAVQANAQFLAQHSNIQLTIEGHCDERGSIEYNLALGDNRANSVKQALVTAGVSSDRIHTVSHGKERPVCNEQSEECWQQNRRVHFVHGE